MTSMNMVEVVSVLSAAALLSGISEQEFLLQWS